ncbi:MAG: tetratricopeptide repeat protein [Planctomycetaceae bacterium]
MTSTSRNLRTAVQRHRSGDIDSALRLYASVLKADPRNADAWHLSGLAAESTGDVEGAESMIRRAIELNPQEPVFQTNLAAVLVNQRRSEEAETLCRQVLRIDERHPEALSHLGTALKQQNRLDEALDVYQAAVRQNPDVASQCNLAAILIDLGQYRDARNMLTAALQISPDQPQLLLNLATAQRHLGETEAAVRTLSIAELLLPNSWELFVNKGNLLMANGDVPEAVEAFQQAIALNSSSPAAVSGFGNALRQLGFWEESLEANQLAAELAPEDHRYQSNLLYGAALSPILSHGCIVQEHFRWAEELEAATPVMPARPLDRSVRPLRIGYVSPDFRNHATMRFLEPVLEAHDHQAFRIFLYSETCCEDAVTERAKAFGDGWCRTVGMSDHRMAQRIAEDRIDILVDLAGHTDGNRLPVFARRPAPVQVSFLGYPETTGLTRIDYFLSDVIRTPDGAPGCFSERIVHLPHGACCVRPEQPVDIGPPPCLTSGKVTLGSTHRPEKISPQTLIQWGRILDAVPNSELFLFRDTYRSVSLRTQLTQLLEHSGIRRSQLRFGWEMPSCYWDIYQDIDILMEVFPWGSGTIAVDSMWMGVPVPTLAGDRHGSRTTASVNHYCGFPELTAATADEYVQLVSELATQPRRLAEYRQQLRPAMLKSVCDGRQFTRDLEAAYTAMWQICLDNEAPQSDGAH